MIEELGAWVRAGLKTEAGLIEGRALMGEGLDGEEGLDGGV